MKKWVPKQSSSALASILHFLCALHTCSVPMRPSLHPSWMIFIQLSKWFSFSCHSLSFSISFVSILCSPRRRVKKTTTKNNNNSSSRRDMQPVALCGKSTSRRPPREPMKSDLKRKGVQESLKGVQECTCAGARLAQGPACAYAGVHTRPSFHLAIRAVTYQENILYTQFTPSSKWRCKWYFSPKWHSALFSKSSAIRE